MDSMITNIWHSRKGQAIETTKKISGGQGIMGGGWKGWKGETILCDTVMVDTSHYEFIKSHRTIQHRVSLNVKYGF